MTPEQAISVLDQIVARVGLSHADRKVAVEAFDTLIAATTTRSNEEPKPQIKGVKHGPC